MKSFLFLQVVFLVLFLFPFLPGNHLSAQIYKYQDKDGTVHFTSDPNNIPAGATILKSFDTKGEEKTTPPENPVEKKPLQAEPAIQVMQTVLQLYHATHTYSETDFFVCADMAVDVWNMIKTKGINARIAVGNVDDPQADWKEFNHAWVVAEIDPHRWIALETTSGNMVPGDKNKNYYRGHFFNTPRELKEYAGLYHQAYELSKRTKGLKEELEKVNNDYDREIKKYNQMVKTYQEKFPDRLLSSGRYKEAQLMEEQINQQARVVKEAEGRSNQLTEIINASFKELEALDQKLDLPIEVLRFN